ncbi:hypothetical protein LWI28_008346 [Acer negundo]|uniref:Uncharacterized protein n=1 Tax=Acer negundo TaxID=4023 RepID=A0AAD5IY32_ACENE|nr:hypothetical protein LWI28_008346 [Acer negundo]
MKKKNHISCLLDAPGRPQDTDEGMAVVVSDFFASLFKSSNPSSQDIRKASTPIRSILTDTQSSSLSAMYTKDEIRKAGRALPSEGLRWTVGDGKSIRVFKDQWILRPSTFKPITSDHGLDIWAIDLIDRNRRGWKVDLLNQLFLPADKFDILKIPVSWCGGQDSIKWHFKKNGSFSVKSGYRLAISERV